MRALLAGSTRHYASPPGAGPILACSLGEDEHMRAITISQPGGPEVLVEQDVPDPTPGPGEVVIEIVAAALNRADVLQRRGKYPPPPGASEYLGLECSGRISKVADDVHGWKVGDEVCALLAGGGYADAVAVPAGQLLAIPSGVGLIEASALPEAVCTAWLNLFSLGRLQPGDTLLVHGGSGGVGTVALQLAHAYGITAYCTASASKAGRLTAYGAARVIDYLTEDFAIVVNELTDGAGVDVILDHIAGGYLERDINCLAIDGRVVLIGAQGGTAVQLNAGMLLAKRAHIIASTLRPRSLADKSAIVTEVAEHVWPLVASGQVKPVIDRAFAMADAAAAHTYFDQNSHIGKIVLVR